MTMDVRLLRIDSRLLHGQVATSWAKDTRAQRILVVSDSAAHDYIRKALLIQAVPLGVRAHVIPVAKLLRLYVDARFEQLPVLILVETPVDAQRLVAGGVKVKQVNIGALSYNESRQMITDTIAVNQEDVAALAWLHAQGIQLDVRKVASDRSKNLWKFLEDRKLVPVAQS